MKLKKPLFSETARGTLAKCLTFSERGSGSQVRFQRKQKDVVTSARTAQRNNFLTAKNMWSVYEVGIAQCGYVLCGGKDINISALPREERAPKFARYVGDVLNFYF